MVRRSMLVLLSGVALGAGACGGDDEVVRPAELLTTPGSASGLSSPGETAPGATAPADAAVQPIAGTEWELVATASGSGAETEVPAGVETPTLFIAGADELIVFTGCNRGRGKATVQADGRTIDVGRLGTTRRFCEPPTGEIERKMLAVLDGKVSAEIDSSGRLRLAKGGDQLFFAAP